MKSLSIFLTYGLIISINAQTISPEVISNSGSQYDNLNGQEALIELKFKAQYESWFVQYVLLDSVLIQNLTQGGDTMLVYPDTILVLDITTGLPFVSHTKSEKFAITQNYPNPFSDITSFKVTLDENGYLDLAVRNIMGQIISSLELSLEAGTHSFTFNSGNERFYLLTANFNGVSQSIKMVSKGTNKTSESVLVYSGSDYYGERLKSQTLKGGFVFSAGDQLRFTGYSQTPSLAMGSDEITDKPESSQIYTFQILEGIRCPGEPIVTDIDGNDYNTVMIAGQCWMKENLKTTTYSNGTTIPNVTDPTAWANLYEGAYVIPYNGLYGAMYNGFTVSDTNGLCPDGWHIPDMNEWSYLAGLTSNGTTLDANKLKSCRQVGSPLGDGCNTTMHPLWFSSVTHFGTDELGFSGLPAGSRSSDGFGWIAPGQLAYWWSSSEVSPYDTRIIYMGYDSDNFYFSSGADNQIGMSVRCIRNGIPKALFSVSSIEGTAPFQVTFSDLTIHKPTNWLWDFGDGNTSSLQNPLHTYNSPGNYTVQLIVSNIHGVDTIAKENHITVNLTGSPIAAFSGNPVLGTVPMTVSFTDESAANPVSWMWDFGDGNTSSLQNPVHTYNTTGSFSVQLSVTNDYGFDTLMKSHYISVYQPCPGMLTVNYEGQVYNTVQIGSQCWLKENLNVGVKVIGSLDQTNNGIIEKYCYHNDDSYCETYGGLYQWNEMMGYTSIEGAQGICPSGWHIPTDDDWKILEGTVDSQHGIGDPVWDTIWWRGFDAGANLKSADGWYNEGNGTDLYGFRSLPGGYRITTYYGIGYDARFWSSTEETGTKAWIRWLANNRDESRRISFNKSYGFAVRCIKVN